MEQKVEDCQNKVEEISTDMQDNSHTEERNSNEREIMHRLEQLELIKKSLKEKKKAELKRQIELDIIVSEKFALEREQRILEKILRKQEKLRNLLIKEEQSSFQKKDPDEKIYDLITGHIIPPELLISVTTRDITHCFNIDTLYRIWVDSDLKSSIINPYTRQPFEKNILKKVYKYASKKNKKFDVIRCVQLEDQVFKLIDNNPSDIFIYEIDVPYYKPVGHILMLIFLKYSEDIIESIKRNYLWRKPGKPYKPDEWDSLYDSDLLIDTVPEEIYKNLIVSSPFHNSDDVYNSLTKLRNYLNSLTALSPSIQNVLYIVRNSLEGGITSSDNESTSSDDSDESIESTVVSRNTIQRNPRNNLQRPNNSI